MSTATPRHAASLGHSIAKACIFKFRKREWVGIIYFLFCPGRWYRRCCNWFPNKTLSSSKELAWTIAACTSVLRQRVSPAPTSTPAQPALPGQLYPAAPPAAVIPTGSALFQLDTWHCLQPTEHFLYDIRKMSEIIP